MMMMMMRVKTILNSPERIKKRRRKYNIIDDGRLHVAEKKNQSRFKIKIEIDREKE